MKKESFESKLQDKLRDFEVPVPPAVWENIDSSLSSQKKNRRKLFPVYTWAAAAASILLVGTYALWMSRDVAPLNVNTPIVAERSTGNPGSPKTIAELTPVKENSTLVEEKANLGQSQLHQRTNVANRSLRKVNKTVIDLSISDEPKSTPIEEMPEEVSTTALEQAQEKPTVASAVVETPSEQEREAARQRFIADAQEIKLIEEHVARKNNDSALSLGLLANGSRSSSNWVQSFGDITLMNTPDEVNAVRLLSVAYMSPYQKPEPTKIAHTAPFSLGLSVQKAINTRWSLETGVVYTYLKSNLTYSGGFERVEEQRLHYLGIPLNIEYDFIRKGRFVAFAKSGVMAEMNIYGTISEKSTYSGNQVLEVKNRVREEEIQWSAILGVGVGYNLSDQVRFSLEPSATYYFDNGSSFITIRKDKPLNFNLKLGAVYRFK